MRIWKNLFGSSGEDKISSSEIWHEGKTLAESFNVDSGNKLIELPGGIVIRFISAEIPANQGYYTLQALPGHKILGSVANEEYASGQQVLGNVQITVQSRPQSVNYYVRTTSNRTVPSIVTRIIAMTIECLET